MSPAPQETLRRRLAADRAVVAGVLSGTSADGIDVALARFERARPIPELVAFATLPFEAQLEGRLRRVLDGAPGGPRETALLSRDLGLAFGGAARALARGQGLELVLVGSHGQTVWHHDGREPSGPASLQLGDGDFVAEAARAAVVSDFRQRDLAAGGEGAPLVGLVDRLVFDGLAGPAAILNLGGMANLTLVPAGDGSPQAFDTGPAGSLLDGLARRLLGMPFDRDGGLAAAGRVDETLLAELAAHPFFERAPPKSTGRDTFGEAWIDGLSVRAAQLGVARPADLMATAVELVAASVSSALERFSPAPAAPLVLCGGGARNPVLVARLAARHPGAVESSAAHGVDPDAREALAFATLAQCFALGQPVTQPGITGAAGGRVLGKLSPAPPRSES